MDIGRKLIKPNRIH